MLSIIVVVIGEGTSFTLRSTVVPRALEFIKKGEDYFQVKEVTYVTHTKSPIFHSDVGDVVINAVRTVNMGVKHG